MHTLEAMQYICNLIFSSFSVNWVPSSYGVSCYVVPRRGGGSFFPRARAVSVCPHDRTHLSPSVSLHRTFCSSL
jgi:hypothetical protein